MSKKTQKEKVEDLKLEIENSDMKRFDIYGNFYTGNKKIGTLYLKDKNEYGFHVYYIFEPNSTNLSGKDGIVTEMYYNLREKDYYVKRNLKEVKFNTRNVESMFPQRTMKEMKEIIGFISTDESYHMFITLYNKLGRINLEKDKKLGRFLHRLITEYSYYELLYKSKVDINSAIIRNPNGKNPKEILGLNNSQWKLVSKMGVQVSSVQDVFSLPYRKVDSSKMLNELTYIKDLEDEFGINVRDSYFNLEGFGHYSVEEIVNRFGGSKKRLIKYLYFECFVSQGMHPRDAISEYEDYMRMSTEMGYNNIIKYPKALKTAHDVVSMNYKVKLSEEQRKQWKEVYENIKHMKTTYKNWVIFPPEKPEDLSDEGNQQNHCVGSYTNNMINGNCIILFMRHAKDPSKSKITVEVRDEKIVQARGRFNRLMDYEETDVLNTMADKLGLDSIFKERVVA